MVQTQQSKPVNVVFSGIQGQSLLKTEFVSIFHNTRKIVVETAINATGHRMTLSL